MWAIVGLGNPGPKYSGTRHNAGFMAVDELAARHGMRLEEKKLYSASKGSINGHNALLVEPLTFMNLSGSAVVECRRKHGTEPEDLIVISDDLDLPVGRIKLSTGGSSGGHRGLESIIQSIGTREFIRIRIGIGRDPESPAEVYVLKRFRPEEREDIQAAVSLAADAVEMIIAEGMERAMNSFNQRKPQRPNQT